MFRCPIILVLYTAGTLGRGRSDRWDVMKGRMDMDKDKVIMDTLLVSILDLEISMLDGGA